MHIIKALVKDLPLFKEVNSSIKNDIIQFFEVLELKANDILLKQEQSASIYVLVEGKLKKSIYAPWNSYKEEEDIQEIDLITQKENFSEIDAFKVFGDFDILNPDKCMTAKDRWKPCYIYSLSKSIIFLLNYEKVMKYMEKIYSQQRALEKLNFLQKNIPALQNQLTSHRDKLVQSFEIKRFLPKQVILREGCIPDQSMIILEGACYLQSKQIPLHLSIMEEDPRRGHQFIASNTGYFSKTMNSFQLGIVSQNEWIGDEVLLILQKIKANKQLIQKQQQDQQQHQLHSTTQNQFIQTSTDFVDDLDDEYGNQKSSQNPNDKKKGANFKMIPGTYLNYSVIAKTNVTVYCISKDDLMNKVPKDILRLLTQQAQKKQSWIDDRFKDIQRNIFKIFNKEFQYAEIYEKSKEATKKYPQASKFALKSITQMSDKRPIYERDNSQEKKDKNEFSTQTVGFLADIQKEKERKIRGSFADSMDSDHAQSKDLYTIQEENQDDQQHQHLKDQSVFPSISQSQSQLFLRNPVDYSKQVRISKHSRDLSLNSKQLAQSYSNPALRESFGETPSSVQNMHQKMILGSASAFRYTSNQKLCLPTLIKNIEMDKVQKVLLNKQAKELVQKQKNMRYEDKSQKFVQETYVGDKRIRFLEQINSNRSMQSTFYMKKQ